MFRTGILTLAVGLLAAGPIQAQQHQHGAGAGAQTDNASHCKDASHGTHAAHEMDASHRYAPGMLLKHAGELKLSEDQVAALEGMKAAHKQDCERRMAAVKSAETAAATELSAAQPDLARYEASLLEAARQKVDCKVDMARMTQQAKALLTAEQLQHVSHMGHAGHTGH